MAAAWKVHVNGPSALCLVRKLNQTKTALKHWNKIHFGNVQKQIKSTLTKIDLIQQAPPCSNTFLMESQLKKDLKDLLVKEEIL